MSTRAPRPTRLGVYLAQSSGDRRVGELRRAPNDRIEFAFDQSYVELGPTRPLLSCRWFSPGNEERTLALMTDDRHRVATGGYLPSWFSGLLPEGALHDIVMRQLGPGRFDEFDVLAYLGADLPGAVVIRSEDTQVEPEAVTETSPRIRFSLAGVQFKLSMRAAKDKVTLPVRGETGDLIVKLPTARFAGMPEAEYSAMRLARVAGVDTAECELLPMDKLEDVPEEWREVGGNFLAVKRFDRVPAGRVHVEDFAQILGAVNDRKYTMGNDETCINIARRFCRDPVPNSLEAARRVAVNVLLGNNDAHLKNWSLLYDDPVRPRLTPAYDIVPVSAYIADHRMALQFQGSNDPFLVSLEGFRRIAGYVKIPEKTIVNEVRTTVQRAADEWPKLLPSLPVSTRVGTIWRLRWEKLALTKSIPTPFPAPNETAVSKAPSTSPPLSGLGQPGS